MQPNTDISSLASWHGDDILDTKMKHATNDDEPNGIFSTEKTVLGSSTPVNENPSLDITEVNTNMDVDVGKMIAATYELRPLLCMLAGSCLELDLSCGVTPSIN
ncbi:hypothetical protein RJT34_15885 [Clitoria ternatea]|uniref:Uncharacterized protein n=1 Tax=Clitoria ternatea TaxID=43366 RepID=A0AAN9J686_CLITE